MRGFKKMVVAGIGDKSQFPNSGLLDSADPKDFCTAVANQGRPGFFGDLRKLHALLCFFEFFQNLLGDIEIFLAVSDIAIHRIQDKSVTFRDSNFFKYGVDLVK